MGVMSKQYTLFVTPYTPYAIQDVQSLLEEHLVDDPVRVVVDRVNQP